MDRSDVTLERIRTFVRVAERGNLSAVARELGVGQSSVTRHLRELEEALGVTLLSRTTRKVMLTEEGSRYYADALPILRLVERASDEVRHTAGSAAGSVRISCTAALGVRHVSRLIFAFQDRHPEISVDLRLTDERIDLVRDGLDIAVRLGPLADSAMKLRAIGQSRRILAAAPAYLAARGRPASPDNLDRLDGIRMSNVAGSETLILHQAGSAARSIPFGGRLRVDHGLAAREALADARGYGPTHVWLIDDLLTDGRVEVILPDHAPPPVPLNMLIAPERADITRVRLMVEYLAEQLPRIPGIEPVTARG
jgi:DNA-binding transcriptional LysR family regulator